MDDILVVPDECFLWVERIWRLTRGWGVDETVKKRLR